MRLTPIQYSVLNTAAEGRVRIGEEDDDGNIIRASTVAWLFARGFIVDLELYAIQEGRQFRVDKTLWLSVKTSFKATHEGKEALREELYRRGEHQRDPRRRRLRARKRP